MNPLVLRGTTAMLVGISLLFAPGCRGASSPKSAAKISPSADASIPVAEEPSEATEAAALGDAISPAPADPTPSVQLGPTKAAVSWAYLKDMYQKDGTWYVVVDYIQVVGPEEELTFLNENSALRTFPLSSGVKLMLLKSPGSPDYKSVGASQFKAFQDKSGDEVVEVTPKGGYATQLKEWWAP